MGFSVRRSAALACASAVIWSVAMLHEGTRVEASGPRTTAVASRRPLQREDVYLPSVMQWEGPAGGGAGTKSHVEIAVFYPWGEFVGARITVSRTADGKMEAL